MARHQDEPFTESENLRIPNPVLPEEAPEGWAPPQGAGPAPHGSAPAYRGEEGENPSDEGKDAGEDAPKADTASLHSGEEAPADEARPAPREADVEDSYNSEADAAIQQQRVRIAQDAWDQEARRVEAGEPEKARKAWAEEDRRAKGDGDAAEETPAKGRRSSKKKKKKNKKKKKMQENQRGFFRNLMIVVCCGVVFVMVTLMILSNFIDSPLLTMPRKAVTSLVTPLQRAFSTVTNSIVDYLRMLKIRGNIEYEYEQLTLMLDDYATIEAQNEEYRRTIQELYALLDEQDEHRDFNPVMATVIATDTGNYFSTLSLDVGTSDGVGEYMAVVAQGGLVGVTYDVENTTCKVRCIINSDCTVAALIQSTRDQGSVKGTLGTTGEAMCRMYYLPDNAVFRPGDMVITSGVGLEFPKGIPIGEVRESTRGMEDNKAYVVVDPVVDFQHLEYVTVYRYRPAYAEEAQSRASGYSATLEPLFTPRPAPTFSVADASDFLFSQEPSAQPTPDGETPAPSIGPTATPRATASPDPNATQPPPNLSYERTATPAYTPVVTPTPSPSPAPTQDPGGMTVEDDT